MERALQQMIQSSDTSAERLRKLVANVEEVSKAVSQGVPCLSDEAIAQLKQAITLQDDKIDIIACSRILKRLAFDGIKDRYNQIEEAHMETFSWFFDDTPSDELQETQSEARILLHGWLEEGSGILHVSGKLGCGKSTLMKFFVDHDQTEAALRAWAGTDNSLIFGSFYFWRPGSPEQKSLPGLLQSLLHDVLRDEPSLAACALPEVWQEVRACPWQADPQIRITDKDIRRGLDNVFAHCKTARKHRLCFFIDGLDEYVEAKQFDHRDMVQMLQRWTNTDEERSRIKICVSSREENVFMRNFPADKRIRLHNLTKHDMERFALAKISHVFNSQTTLAENVKVIVEKAQGIFLWVSLVVKEIRRQHENKYDPIIDIRSFLDLVPGELNDLYRYILSTLLSSDEKYKAHCTFAMMKMFRDELGDNVLLWQYSFLEEYLENAKIATRGPEEKLPRGKIAAAQPILMRAKLQLNGWCRGLVEVLEPKSKVYDSRSASRWLEQQELVFAHRSIPEFLSTPEIQQEGRQLFENGHFNGLEAMSRLVLAGIQAMDGIPLFDGVMQTQALAVVALRASRGVPEDLKPPFAFLNALDGVHAAWMAEYMGGSEGKHPIGTGTFLAVHPRSSDPDSPRSRRILIGDVRAENPITDRPLPLEKFLMVNAACQLLLEPAPHPYPLWVIAENKPRATDTHAVPLMICTALKVLQRSILYDGSQGSSAAAEALFNHISHHNDLKTLVSNARAHSDPDL